MHTSLPLPGDIVWIRQQRWRVTRAIRDQLAVRLEVESGGHRRTFLSPFDRPVPDTGPSGRRVASWQEATARIANAIARARDLRLPLTLLDADARVLPHQLEPTLALLSGRPRLLIADEVGLGKTIQASLAIAELLRREAAPRILVLTPASLRDQWQEELRSRFGIDCLLADRRGLDALARSDFYGADPWRRSGVWLASPDFLKQPAVLRSLPQDPWDLVVIDEAHGVCGDSDRYAACQAVAQRARRLLLLTATPHSGDDERFGRLLELGRLGAKDDGVVVFRRTRDELGWPRRRHVRWHRVRLKDAESRVLAELRAFECAALERAGASRFESALLLLAVFRKRALSTFTALSRSLERRLAFLGDAPAAASRWAQPRFAFDEDSDDLGARERMSLASDIGLDPQDERAWLLRLRQLADDAAREDSKIARIAALVERTAEPVVVFTEFRDSLETLHRRLRRSRAISVLHGGQSNTERRSELGRFLSGPSTVLLATDVAGQGLNLQSRSRWVVSLELPWNPARLEQRVGRVDRLGQARPTHLTLIVARHEFEDGLLAHLSRRVLIAQQSFSEDVLTGMAPPESVVGSSLLLSNGPLNAEDVAVAGQTSSERRSSTSVCRRWRRAAATIAAALTKRRGLASRWRGPKHDQETVRSVSPRHKQLAGDQDEAVVVCSVAIRSGLGEPVDCLVLALTVPRALAALGSDSQLRDAIRQVAKTPVGRRLAKVRRIARVSAARALRREIAIRDHARGDQAAREGQPGLFDSRLSWTLETRAATDADLERVGRSRAGLIRAAATLESAAPEIDFVLVRSR